MDTLETLKKVKKTEAKKEKKFVSGAEAVILSLIGEEVETVFGYPGGAIMPVYDALYDFRDKVNHILVRHEQGATHAAQGYARVSGKVGVSIATSGPGATNMITGIADARIDSTPIVCITGQVFSNLLGTDAFQETDVVGISLPITKWNYQITNAEEIPEVMAKAFYIARTGRPGPVLIDITKDAQVQKFEFEYNRDVRIRSYQPIPDLPQDQIEKAAELINNAEKPFCIFGQGVLLSNAEKEFTEFLDKSGIPAGWTILGLSALPHDHPLNVGMLGMHGNYAPNVQTNECDVLIAVGMRFDDRVTGSLNTYARQAKIIHIEIDRAEIDKNVKVDVPVHADAKEALTALTKRVNKRSHDQWVKEFRDLEKIEYDKIINKELYPTEGMLRMGEVVRAISDHTDGEAIVVTDVGQHQMVTQRYYKFRRSHSNVTSGGLGTMGFALPAAMGAQSACPGRDVVAVIGDGGFQMTLQELATIAQEKLPVKIVILNNNFLGMVRQWQQMFFERRYSFTELENPDFVMIAQGFGIKAVLVTDRDKLDGVIEDLLKHDGPMLLEIKVKKEDNVFPMIPAGESVSNIKLEI